MLKKFMWFLLFFLIFSLLINVFLVIVHKNFKLTLNEKSSYIINLGEEFNDPGVTCEVLNYDLTDKVNVTNNLNNNKIGVYQIKYIIDFLGKIYNVSRKISVIDSVAPNITLNGDNKITIYAGSNYTELGATAFDNYDGNLTDKISISNNININIPGIYEVTYVVKDSSGNENSIKREVEVKKVVTINRNNDTSIGSILKKALINEVDVINFIKNNNYSVSIGYFNLVNGNNFYYNKDKVYYGASLIKTVDALYLYDNNLVNAQLKEHIKKAISVSNNESHKYLVNYLGKETLKKYGIGLGAMNTLAGRDYYGNTTVNDQMIYMKKLYDITKDNNNELKSFFINNYANHLKFNEINVMHKYGWYDRYFHESGIFLDKNPYILIVLTEHGKGNFSSVIKNISKVMYKYHVSN